MFRQGTLSQHVLAKLQDYVRSLAFFSKINNLLSYYQSHSHFHVNEIIQTTVILITESPTYVQALTSDR